MQQGLTKLIDNNLVSLKKNDLWLEIEIKSSVLFPSGSSHPTEDANPVLDKIAEILKTYQNQIQVEGFTDNIPINTDEFPSNWELSAARAASVVHLFTKQRVDPGRLSAVGFGEYKPIASNKTPDGRSKNRRITIVVLSDAIARTSDRTQQASKTTPRNAKNTQKTSPSASPNQASIGTVSTPTKESATSSPISPINILPPARQTIPGGN